MRLSAVGVGALARSSATLVVGAACSALVWLVALGVLGMGCIVAGCFALWGAGWALIAGGVALLAMAAFIKHGITNG